MNMLMKSVVVLLLGFSHFASAQAPTAAPRRSITQVAGEVYRFQNNDHFGIFMVTPRGVLVVDPINLDTATWLKGEIAARFKGAKVVEVLYSHHDWDHAAGAAAFGKVKVVSRVETLKHLQAPAGDAKAVEEFQKRYADVVMPTDTYHTSVHRIALGGKTVEMHHVISRHADDLSYVYFPQEKVLFIVDVVSLQRMPFRNLPGFDKLHQESIHAKALAFDAAIIVGGHGAIGGKQDVEDQRQYLRDLEDGVQAGIARGDSLEQIKSRLMLEKYAKWANYEQFRPLNIEGMYAYLGRK